VSNNPRVRERVVFGGLLLALASVTACGGDPVATTMPLASPSLETPDERTATAAPAIATPTAMPTSTPVPGLGSRAFTVRSYPVPAGSRPHDVAPAADGGVWYTAQRTGELGWLDPVTGVTRHIDLGPGSAPHGVIVGPDGAPWITDSGLNAIVRVDPATDRVEVYPLPAEVGYANLNTAVFGREGTLWFTGQSGFYGRLVVSTGELQVFSAPGGRGPYGITVTPGGDVYYASLAGNHIARIDTGTGEATRIEPPTAGQGARRVWSDSAGNIWVSEWNSGQLSRYAPDEATWSDWRLPGEAPRAYAVYVDEDDGVWVTDFGGNAIVFFDPALEQFTTFPLERSGASVRQLLGRPGEVWGAESANDHLVVVRW